VPWCATAAGPDVDALQDFEEELRRLWVKTQLKKLRREVYLALALASVTVLGLALLGAWVLSMTSRLG
jgi:hypothetical protein